MREVIERHIFISILVFLLPYIPFACVLTVYPPYITWAVEKKLRWEWLVPVWLQLNIWDNAYLNMENCVLHMMCYAHILILVLSSCSILGGKYIAEILECMWRQYCTVCTYWNRSKYLSCVELSGSRWAIKLYSGYSDTRDQAALLISWVLALANHWLRPGNTM